MIKSPSRPRDFSQFRHSPSQHTISRRNVQATPTQSHKQLTQIAHITPSKPPQQTLTPTKPRRTFTSSPAPSTASRCCPASHPQHLCVNCINKCLIKQHERQRTREKLQSQPQYDQSPDPRDQQRQALEQHFKESQIAQLRDTQQQKQRQKEVEA